MSQALLLLLCVVVLNGSDCTAKDSLVPAAPPGAPLFNTMLYQSRRVRRFISFQDLLLALTVLTTIMLVLFAVSVSPTLHEDHTK